MLTKLIITNFKGIPDCSLDLDNAVVFVGPNNSGKTTALQALSLWEVGVRAWLSKRTEESKAKKRPGVTVNRRDVIAIPVSDAKLLWKKQKVRIGKTDGQNKQKTENVHVTVTVCGTLGEQEWTCGLEFDYANPESFYCRPTAGKDNILWNLTEQQREMLTNLRVAFLPPMSGLIAVERKLEQGSIDVLIGEGQTAQVLRNLCYMLFQDEHSEKRAELHKHMEFLFGIRLLEVEYDPVRGEIFVYYANHGDSKKDRLELSSAGRGLQQTLLILSFLYLNPGAIVLLDEPDAHLEVLRQKQIYEIIKSVAREQRGQILAATHSEVVLNESATKDTVIAFLGTPHLLNDNNRNQLVKSLAEYGWMHYFLAEQEGWVLYLEGLTDLDILREFAKLLNHPVKNDLVKPFLHPMGNNFPKSAEKHFHALREAKPNLLGFALFDRIPKEQIKNIRGLKEWSLERNEIENYFCTRDVLLRWARGNVNPLMQNTLWTPTEQDEHENAMLLAIKAVEESTQILKKTDLWSPNLKASDDVLRPILENYYERLGRSSTVQKARFHELVQFMKADEVNKEIREVLDEIHRIAVAATQKNTVVMACTGTDSQIWEGRLD